VKNWTALAIALLSASVVAAQQPADVAAGQRLFASNCAVCHGADGTGGTSPVNLARGGFKHGGSDQELFDTITKGIPGTEMPGSFLNPSEIKQVVEFVQALAGISPSGGGAGDAVRGESLFRGKGGCLPCHRITEEGSHGGGVPLGPNLYAIGDRRSFSSLQNSIRRVHNGLAEFHWQVTAVTQSGKRVAGTRLNEDTYSIQLRDTGNNLVSLLKKDLKEFKIERGDPMPAFDSGISDTDVSDLAAYLSTLRRGNAGR
jgi:putative heme-binding domain-containing protein